MQIPSESRFVLDTSSYHKAVISDWGALKSDSTLRDSMSLIRMRKVFNDDLQPVQVRYFDGLGNPLFKLVNCYIDPPIPMTWNVEGCFDYFPPRINIPALNDFNQSIQYFLPHIMDLSGRRLESLGHLPKADYYVMVFWNSFFRRPSKRLVSTIKRHIDRNKDQQVFVLYVNNHHAELWQRMTPEQKRLVNASHP